ncbi:M20/M25/M40 family metallo-hydrolase [Nocardiopsis exhalans]|uniref:M20/M25/M40 family metallo-hydrolase n=1 Tax=Nocardiopsis exhalans TaxID=163604 RepID=A0ABY5DES5_9ACTN|nr:M28 family peptidase [Nocardiopsis exhalans]USY21530.1 M20/M25/M40 family metallo-hydrolase [Nocardiopsis exhalans]
MHPSNPGNPPEKAGSSPTRRRTAVTAGLAALLMTAGALAASPAHADEVPLPDLVTAEAIEAHLANLNTIAEYNGGNRATNTPGYDVAALYVEDQLKRAGYEPYRHEYDYEAWRENSPAVLSQTTPEKIDYELGEHFETMSYSGAGSVRGNKVTAVNPEAGDSGCAAEQFADFPEGNIALIKRGSCPFGEKVQNAADAGASAALVFNNEDEVFLGTVSELSDIPAIGVSGVLGEELASLTRHLRLKIEVDSEVNVESSYSILAETPGGRADNVVVVGGHLDSVEEGPGINDNGSGSAFLLETAIQLAKQEDPNNKVRFAFWGTEESGLVGSNEYVADLTEGELDDIALYLNFDMIGSHNYGRFVLDGRMELPGSGGAPSGSGAIAKVFEDYFEDQGQVSEPGVLSGRSDYFAFMQAGVPSGGLFSGADGIKSEEQVEWYGGTAGEMFDPYYHTPEDTMENINWDSVAELSAAGAHGVEFFAESTLPVNGVLSLSAVQVDLPRKGDAWLR